MSAVGWAGSPAAIPSLITLLGNKDLSIKLTAAYALDRITNAGLYDVVVVEDEEIMVPDIPEPAGDPEPRREPLARKVSDPRDLPAEPTTDTVQRPTIQAERWLAWWKEKQDSFNAKVRTRRGAPYTPHTSWRELDLWPLTPGERKLLHWELVARTGDFLRFDPHDFVVVQEAAIAEWEQPAKQASGSPGSWNVAARRGPKVV